MFEFLQFKLHDVKLFLKKRAYNYQNSGFTL